MKQIVFCWFCFLMVVFVGCSNATQERNDKMLKIIEEGLLVSNAKLDGERMKFLRETDQKLEDPCTRDMMQYWQSCVLKADSLSNNIDKYFISLKDSVGKGELSNILKEQAAEIYGKLQVYRVNMLSLDSSVTNEFKCCFTITTKSFDSTDRNTDEFYQEFFHNNSVAANVVSLTKLQNNIKNRQNEIMEFFLKRVSCQAWIYDFHKVIVSQSATLVKPNEKFEVYAGVGNFTSKANVDIAINGEKQGERTPEGDYMIKIKASTKTGKHIVPIMVTYIDNKDKQPVSFKKNIVYYVDSITTKQ